MSNKTYICRDCGLAFSDKDKAADCCGGRVMAMNLLNGRTYYFSDSAETASASRDPTDD